MGFCWDEAGQLLPGWGLRKLGWRWGEMKKKGPETWGREKGWKEVVAMEEAQKIAGNHQAAHKTGSRLSREQQCLQEVS